METLLNNILNWRRINKAKDFPKTELVSLFGLQLCICFFLFQTLVTYLSFNFHATDAAFVESIKSFPAIKVFTAIVGIAAFLGFKDRRIKPSRLFMMFSLLGLLGASAIHFVPSDMVISGASQAQQTAVFGPLTLMITGVFGAAINLVWLAFYYSGSHKETKLI